MSYLLRYLQIVRVTLDNRDIIKKNTETLIDASKEVGLEVNAEKTKYCLITRLHYMKVANRCLENIA
jgi:hypothetical protein